MRNWEWFPTLGFLSRKPSLENMWSHFNHLMVSIWSLSNLYAICNSQRVIMRIYRSKLRRDFVLEDFQIIFAWKNLSWKFMTAWAHFGGKVVAWALRVLEQLAFECCCSSLECFLFFKNFIKINFKFKTITNPLYPNGA